MATSGREKLNAQRYIDMLVNVATEKLYTVLNWATQGKHPNVHFDEYIRCLGVSKKDLNFNDTEMKKIQDFPDGKDFDISLLAKCLLLICRFHSIWKSYPDKVLESLIKELRDIRNKTLHVSKLCLTNAEFDEEIDALEKCLNALLDAAKERFIRSESERDTKKKEMEDGLFKIRQEILGDEDLLVKHGPKIKADLLNHGKKELEDNLEMSQTFDPLDNVISSSKKMNVAKTYTNVVFKRSDNKNKEKVEYSNFLSVIDSRAIKPQILMVEGDAGSGKTMLLEHMGQEWLDGSNATHKMDGLSQYELVFKVVCRDTHIISFKELVGNLMPNFYRKYRELGLSVIKKSRLLLLIDGLDEQNDKSHKLIQSLLDELRKSPSCVMICTSRPESISLFEKNTLLYLVKSAKLLGIDKTQRSNFLMKYLQEWRPQGNTDDLLKKCGKICDRDHYGLPNNLVFLVWQYIHDPDSINEGNTPTDLYHWVHQLRIQKLMKRLNDWTLDKSDFEKLVSEILGLAMLQDLAHDRLVLSEQTIDQIKSACQKRLPNALPVHKELFSAFLTMTRTKTPLGDEETYAAPHKGTQEYLAALYVVGKFRTCSGQCTLLEVLEGDLPVVQLWLEKLQNMLQHIAGILYQQLEPDDPRLDTSAVEVVGLMYQAGVKSQQNWLSVIEDTKMAPAIIKSISQYFPLDDIVVSKRLPSWCKLLPHLKQTDVKIVLTDDPSSLANLVPDSLHHRYTVVKLDQYYYHPALQPTTDVDNFLQHILPRKELREFAGPLTSIVSSSLSKTIPGLRLSVNSDTEASLLPFLHTLTNLEYLDVHVTKELSLAALPGPLPAITNGGLASWATGTYHSPTLMPITGIRNSRVFLVISDVTTNTIDRAVNIAERLQPSDGYHDIIFPWSDMTCEELRLLVEGLGRGRVSVWGYLAIPDTRIITGSQDMELQELIRTKLRQAVGLFRDCLRDYERPQQP